MFKYIFKMRDIVKHFRLFAMQQELAIFIMLFCGKAYSENHKIVYLISSPRSLSTLFLRMMYERGDFEIFSEPSQYAFNRLTWPQVVGNHNVNALCTFEEVKEALFNTMLQSDVFVKEMIGAALTFLPNDEEFLSSPDIYFVFLIRNPHHTIISWLKRRSTDLPNNLSERIGCKAMYELFNVVKEKAVHTPLLMFSEDLYQYPEETIRLFCEHVHIPFDKRHLTWQPLGDDFTGAKEWHQATSKEIVQHWYGAVIASTGFGIPHQYEVDAQGEPTFSEIHPELRSLCFRMYADNMPYYQLLRMQQ